MHKVKYFSSLFSVANTIKMDSLISNASTYESFFSDVFGSNSDSDCEDGSFDFSDPMINRKRQSSSPIQENEGLPPDDSPPKRKKSEEIGIFSPPKHDFSNKKL